MVEYSLYKTYKLCRSIDTRPPTMVEYSLYKIYKLCEWNPFKNEFESRSG